MNLLSDYLKRIQKVLGDRTQESRYIRTILSKDFGIEVLESDISISGKIVVCSVNPVLKNKLFISREKILKKFQKEGLNITEIR